MQNLKKTRYLLRSGNSMKRKTTPGQPNLGNPLSKNKASYKTLITYPYAVVIPLTLTCNPIRMPPNQIFHLKGFFMDSFTLGLTPKIDFTRTTNTHRKQLVRASRYLILPKHPLKALWNSPPNSVQNTNQKPPIYRL